ncbi:Uncharacterised protein [Mycobacteroides abscessus]|nr:Uncharacterised protein [Mycobacteroides abscessus]
MDQPGGAAKAPREDLSETCVESVRYDDTRQRSRPKVARNASFIAESATAASGRRCSSACHSSHRACSSRLPFVPSGRTVGSQPGNGSRAAEREAASRRTSTRGAAATLGETAGAVAAAVARSSALGPTGRVSGSKGDPLPSTSSAPAESGIAMVAAASVPRTATRGTQRCWLETCAWGRRRREPCSASRRARRESRAGAPCCDSPRPLPLTSSGWLRATDDRSITEQ